MSLQEIFEMLLVQCHYFPKLSIFLASLMIQWWFGGMHWDVDMKHRGTGRPDSLLKETCLFVSCLPIAHANCESISTFGHTAWDGPWDHERRMRQHGKRRKEDDQLWICFSFLPSEVDGCQTGVNVKVNPTSNFQAPTLGIQMAASLTHSPFSLGNIQIWRPQSVSGVPKEFS